MFSSDAGKDLERAEEESMVEAQQRDKKLDSRSVLNVEA